MIQTENLEIEKSEKIQQKIFVVRYKILYSSINLKIRENESFEKLEAHNNKQNNFR
jgi:hypothetical protein